MTTKQSFDLNGLVVGVEVKDNEMHLTFEGHGDFDDPGGSPIIIENDGGSVKVCIYSDVNYPFPMHTISLDGALETAFLNRSE